MLRRTAYLAWRYLRHHRLKTLLLVCSIGLVIYLPLAVQLLVAETATQMSARAAGSPLLVGAEGSELELTLNSLYFRRRPPDLVDYGLVRSLRASGHGQVIPLYVRFQARGHPVVATELPYFGFRGLRVARGRGLALPGEAVLGSAAAAKLGLAPGDSLVTSPESVFDLAGVYPLKLRVVGVLATSRSEDDQAVFVDLKSAWIIQGLGHGHQDLAAPEASAGVLRTESDRIIANASVVQYNEVDAGNLESFHFHGDDSAYPLSGVLVVPKSHRDETLLLGEFQSGALPGQILRPRVVMAELLATVFSVKQYVVMAMSIVLVTTLALAALIFGLSARLRQREIETMLRMGSSRQQLAAILGSEIVIVLLLAGAFAGALFVLTRWVGMDLMQAIILT